MTVSQVLDLAGREPVRRRFRFADDDLARIEQWVRESNVRWGFDSDHRRDFELGGIGANTWRSGLDRVLLGVAMAEDDQRLFAETLPLDDVESGDIELAGRLAELVERLHSAVEGLAGDHTMRAWAGVLAEIADSLTATSPGEAWQRAELTSLLDKLVEEAKTDSGDSGVTIGCADVHSLLTERLKGKATRANFCTGFLTVCTLVPMRSIPHKVVCLLGLDDGSFPRHIERDGDDLTAQDPRVGDRDARSEDRQLLLDALLAAREHLVITYGGHDERSNQPRPPAVPVGELFDVVDHTVRTSSGRARDAIRVEHPLQPFDPRNFEPGKLIPARPWSFDELNLDGARAALAPGPTAPAVPGPALGERARDHRRRPARPLPARSRQGLPAGTARRVVVGPDAGVRGRHPDRDRCADPVGDCRADPAGPARGGELGRLRAGRDRPGDAPAGVAGLPGARRNAA